MAGANNAAATTRDKKGRREERRVRDSRFRNVATADSKRFSLINLRSRQRVLRHHPDNRGDRPRSPSYITCKIESNDLG